MSTSASTFAHSDQGDPLAIGATARGFLLFLILSSLLWLVAGLSLLLVHSIQAHTPGFFGFHEYFTFGRMHAAARAALLFGWAANAGFAMAFWVLDRLGNAAPRGTVLSLFAAVAWNVAVTLAMVAIITGDFSGNASVPVPGHIAPILMLVSLLLGAAGLFSWADRKKETTFASHDYAALSLFVIPWLLSVLAVVFYFYPTRGVLSAVAGAWVAQNLISLWLAPMALAAAYYLVPKVTGSGLPGYTMAVSGFWILMVFAPWTGTRVLAGGPFPVWVPSVGIAAGLVLLCHYAIVFTNLSDALFMQGKSYVLRFLGVSVASYAVYGLVGAVSSLRTLSQYVQFTYWSEALFALFLLGLFAPAAFAVIYFLVPRLSGRSWVSDGLIIMHYRASVTGLLLLVVGLGGAGLVQGIMQSSQELSLPVMSGQMKPWLLIASAGCMLQLLGAIFLLVNFAFQLLPLATREGSPEPSSTVSAS